MKIFNFEFTRTEKGKIYFKIYNDEFTTDEYYFTPENFPDPFYEKIGVIIDDYHLSLKQRQIDIETESSCCSLFYNSPYLSITEYTISENQKVVKDAHCLNCDLHEFPLEIYSAYNCFIRDEVYKSSEWINYGGKELKYTRMKIISLGDDVVPCTTLKDLGKFISERNDCQTLADVYARLNYFLSDLGDLSQDDKIDFEYYKKWESFCFKVSKEIEDKIEKLNFKDIKHKYKTDFLFFMKIYGYVNRGGWWHYGKIMFREFVIAVENDVKRTPATYKNYIERGGSKDEDAAFFLKNSYGSYEQTGNLRYGINRALALIKKEY